MPASRPEWFFKVAKSEVRIVRDTGANQAGDVRAADVFALQRRAKLPEQCFDAAIERALRNSEPASHISDGQAGPEM
jgi:hypothetical protein